MSPVIEVEGIVTRFGERTIHDGVNLHINQNEIYVFWVKVGLGNQY